MATVGVAEVAAVIVAATEVAEGEEAVDAEAEGEAAEDAAMLLRRRLEWCVQK